MECPICNHFRRGQPRDHFSDSAWHEVIASAESCYCCRILVSGCGQCFQQHRIVESDILRVSVRFYYPAFNDNSSCDEEATKELIFALRNEKFFQIELFVTEDEDCPAPDAWDHMPVSRRISQRSDSPEVLGAIKGWIADCVDTHSLCNSPGVPNLPTRVVDVGFGSQVIKLVETCGAKGSYICLSHCWGLAQIIRTTISTIEKHKIGISWQELSNTFRDAITFTKILGFRYIWIDSLCIVQDDARDWAIESAKMASVYSNGYLTLAGTRAADGHGGLFHSTKDAEITGVTPNGEEYCLYFRERIDHHLEQCEDESNKTMRLCNPTRLYYPLLTRAWVYQERMLSARVIHFGHYEVFFECRSGVDCECAGIDYYGSSDAAPIVQMKAEHSLALQNPTQSEDKGGKAKVIYRRAQLWRTMVATYTALHLTKPDDRLPAIGGLARDMATRRQSTYLAGLWEETLNDDLLWTVPAVLSKKPRTYPLTAPSWSWASVGNFVRYWDEILFTDIDHAHLRPERPPFEHFAKVNGCHVTPGVSAVDEFGTIACGRLWLTGLVAQGMLEHKMELHDGAHVMTSYFIRTGMRLQVKLDFLVECRNSEVEIPPIEVSCIRMSHVVEGSTGHLIALVLRRSLTTSGVFERIGTMVVTARPPPVDFVAGPFREAESMTLIVE